LSQRKSNDEIIEAFEKIHKFRYDYSLVNYLGANKKVRIICKEHGIFEQTPSKHLSGRGCISCGGKQQYNNDSIIEKFRIIHGDRYDYSKVKYEKSQTKVQIVCQEHGVFEQSPNHHLRGVGCPDCGGRFRYNNEKIIIKFREIHGDNYDYSQVEFKGTKTNVKIICNKHGVFKQTPGTHLRGAGCPDCNNQPRYDNNKIISKFKLIHGDKYDYSQVCYIKNSIKITIKCHEHGFFEQTPSNHLMGKGCIACSGVNRYDNDTILTKFRAVHGEKYDYSQVEYKGGNNKVIIVCPKHGRFLQRPTGHASGKGCPDCGGNIRYDNEKIVAKFRGVHGDKYDYSQVQYNKYVATVVMS
jgi:hypothetical protein